MTGASGDGPAPGADKALARSGELLYLERGMGKT
jgi:hypothetical protein